MPPVLGLEPSIETIVTRSSRIKIQVIDPSKLGQFAKIRKDTSGEQLDLFGNFD